MKCPKCYKNKLKVETLEVEMGNTKAKLLKTVAKCPCGYQKYPVPERWGVKQ